MKVISKKQKGFSILEIILAAALFCIFSSAAVSFLFLALKAETQSQQAGVALQYAKEGLETVRAIRDDSFDRLQNTDGSGLEFFEDGWDFDGSYDEFDIFRRSIVIETVKRDEDENIILEDGENDPNMKRIISLVSWTAQSGENVSVEMETYLSRWK